MGNGTWWRKRTNGRGWEDGRMAYTKYLSLVRYCCTSHGPWHVQPIMKSFKSSKLKIKCFFLLVITKELKDREGLKMDLCEKYFIRKDLSFSSGHNLTCHALCVPKTLHCRNTDKMVLPTKLKNSTEEQQQKQNQCIWTIRANPVTVPDRQCTQDFALLCATTGLQRMVSSLEEGWIRGI